MTFYIWKYGILISYDIFKIIRKMLHVYVKTSSSTVGVAWNAVSLCSAMDS